MPKTPNLEHAMIRNHHTTIHPALYTSISLFQARESGTDQRWIFRLYALRIVLDRR